MRNLKRRLLPLLAVVLLLCSAMTVTAFAAGDEAAAPSMYGTFWALIPPFVAIILALITKQAYLSLFLGVIVGGLFVCDFAPITTLDTVLNAGLIDSISGNAGIFLFLVLLGIIVAMVNASGASAAFGRWAEKNIKSKTGAMLATFVLGVLIFIDDYFNCLTVGTVMRPVTDRVKLSREKLAYLIDATAAPICIIAPISSWAASVISYYPETAGMSGMMAFLSSVPMNLYAILTLIMVFTMAARKNADYGPMLKAELNAEKGIISDVDMSKEEEKYLLNSEGSKGKICDLVVPIVILIIASILSMIYVGGYWGEEKMSLFDAFGNTDAGAALALGAFVTLIITFIYYMCRKVLTFRDFFSCMNPGVNSMVAACVILTLAWTISGVCRDLLSTGPYVASLVENSGVPMGILPMLIFVVACLLSFSTGTAWGTFGILIPIIISICEIAAPELLITTLSATLAGSVFGDHTSPISDTTILASTGARCDHLKHVGTQVPYALTVAVCCAIGYIVAGFTAGMGFAVSTVITLIVSIVCLAVLLIALPKVYGRKKYETA